MVCKESTGRITRDCFGNLTYVLNIPVTEKYSRVYMVTRGQNTIDEIRPYLRTNAVFYYGNNFWEDVGKFDSFIKAVRYLKENKDRLL